MLVTLAVGCVGEQAGEGIDVQGATSSAADATTTTEPTTTRHTSATTRSTIRPTTTRRTATTRPITSEPANPILTVHVDDPDKTRTIRVGKEDDPDGVTCAGECSYDQFPLGTRITIKPGDNRSTFTLELVDGELPCKDVFSCTITLTRNTVVTAKFLGAS